MANTQKDVWLTLEYYEDKTSVLDGSNKRNPTKLFQNFYQAAQDLTTIDSAGPINPYYYLAFDADGFSNSEASSTGSLTVNLAATSEIIDLSDTAIGGDRLVICSLYIQNTGQDAVHSSAQLISRYTGTISSVGVSDQTVTWQISASIAKDKGQVPCRRIASDLIGRFEGY